MPRLVLAARLLRLALLSCCSSGTVLLLLVGVLRPGTVEGGQALAVGALLGVATLVLLLLQPAVVEAVLRLAPRCAVPLMVAGSAAALALYVLAGLLLRAGPSPDGWLALGLADRFATGTALFTAGVQVAVVLAGVPRLRERATTLAILAVATTVPVAALALLGGALAGMRPAEQPLDLNAMLLAVQGVGLELVPVPVAFAVAAALLPVAARLREAWIPVRLIREGAYSLPAA